MADLGSFAGAPFEYSYGNHVLIVGIPWDFIAPYPVTSLTKTVSGVVKNISGIPVSRKVSVFERSSGIFIGTTTSDSSTGYYSISVPDLEVNIIAYDDTPSPTLNDLIIRVVP